MPVANSTAIPNRRGLGRAATLCFMAIAAGQMAFTFFIVAYYYTRTFGGDFAAWNDKPIITGYVVGDMFGNLMFAAHVLFAAVITFGGLVQLIPAIRARWPRVHRLNGRLFLLSALVMSLGGLWITWVRGSYLNVVGAFGTSMNALLILTFAGLAWRAARARDYARHRRWALRLFVVASAVWFMRVGYLVWGMATGGAGIGDNLNGPFDLFLAYANSLVPLAVLELYLRAERSASRLTTHAVSALLIVSTLAILAGSVGAWFAMWGPYL